MLCRQCPMLPSAESFHLTAFFSAHSKIPTLGFPADPFYIQLIPFVIQKITSCCFSPPSHPHFFSYSWYISLASTVVPLRCAFRRHIIFFTSSATMLLLCALARSSHAKMSYRWNRILGMPVVAEVPTWRAWPENLFIMQFIENSEELVPLMAF